MGNRRSLVVIVSGLLLGACAATPPRPPPPRTHVSYRAVADQHAPHYHVTSMQTIANPLPSAHNGPPVYPPQLVARHLPPMRVRVKLIVGTQGQVSGARFAQPNASSDVRQAFQDAVRAAVMTWRFEPLTVNQWVAAADGSQRVVAMTPKPFSQDYVFSFRLVDGKPVVTNGAVPAPAASSTSHQ